MSHPYLPDHNRPPQGWVIRETTVHEVYIGPAEPQPPPKKRRWLWRFIAIYAVIWFAGFLAYGLVR